MAMAVDAEQVVRLREPTALVKVELIPDPPTVLQEAPPADPNPAPEETAKPDHIAEPVVLPWRGTGNVVLAAGCAFLALAARA